MLLYNNGDNISDLIKIVIVGLEKKKKDKRGIIDKENYKDKMYVRRRGNI